MPLQLPHLKAADDIENLSVDKRWFPVSSAQGQFKLARDGMGWGVLDQTTGALRDIGPAVTMAMALIECCAELGYGKVYFMIKGDDSAFETELPWTPATMQLPGLLYIGFVWDEVTKKQWFNYPHAQRVDTLNARAGALDLNQLTMPVTLTYERDNYKTLKFIEALAPITLTYNTSGHAYLGFTKDMATNMEYFEGQSAENRYRLPLWQGEKTRLTKFKVASGPQVVARLKAMYTEARPGTMFFLRTLIKEAIRGHNEWVKNGGYTIEGDASLGTKIAREFEAALQGRDRRQEQGNRLEELRNVTSQWSSHKRATLQEYFDIMNRGVTQNLSEFVIMNQGWSTLSQEERDIALELWPLQHENDLHVLEETDAGKGTGAPDATTERTTST